MCFFFFFFFFQAEDGIRDVAVTGVQTCALPIHQCLLMRDHTSGRPFDWEFVRGPKVVPVNASGQLLVNDVGALLAACLGGQGIAQVLDLYTREFLANGRLVQILPAWADETYPLYAYHHSAQLMSAKVRAFLDLVIELTREASGARAGS